MLRTYYRYDSDDCTFVPVSYGFSEFRKRFLRIAGISLLSASLISLSIIFLFPEVIENRIRFENKEQRQEWQTLNDQLKGLQLRMNVLEKQDDDHFRVALGLEKLPPEIRLGGTGGHEEFELNGAENVEEIKNAFNQITQLKSKIRLQSESYEDLNQSLEETEEMLASRPAIQPIDNRQLTRFHPLFGMRLHPVFGDWRSHNGLDLTAETGTPVYATGDGIVTTAEHRGGYGKAVFINHGYGFETRYAHLSKFKVSEGQKVKRGTVIGLVGNTGTSTGPHLHYEVLFQDKFINPIDFMYRNLRQVSFNEIIREARK